MSRAVVSVLPAVEEGRAWPLRVAARPGPGLSTAHAFLRLEIEVAPTGHAGGRRRRNDLRVLYSHPREQRESLTAPRLRRVLGKALVDGFCPFGAPRCQERGPSGAPAAAPAELCDQARSCPYGVLYAASRSRRPPFSIHLRPGVIRGEVRVIELTLYGSACRGWPWILTALSRALGRGLGRERSRWRIVRVFRVSARSRRDWLCGVDLRQISTSLATAEFRLGLNHDAPSGRVEVKLLSPSRLVRDGKLLWGTEPVPFTVLIARILDRFEGLYGAEADLLRADFRSDLEAAAAEVPLIADETHWVEVRDYSARKRAELRLGGKVGRLVYGEGAARFLPILKAGEILHVGKNPTAGCGRIRVATAPPPTEPAPPRAPATIDRRRR